MNRMKKFAYLLTFGIILIATQTQAQSDYKTAFGGRVGIPIAASLKHFIF